MRVVVSGGAPLSGFESLKGVNKQQQLKIFVFSVFFFVPFVVKNVPFAVKKCGLYGKSLLLVKRNIPFAAHDASAFQSAIFVGLLPLIP